MSSQLARAHAALLTLLLESQYGIPLAASLPFVVLMFNYPADVAVAPSLMIYHARRVFALCSNNCGSSACDSRAAGRNVKTAQDKNIVHGFTVVTVRSSPRPGTPHWHIDKRGQNHSLKTTSDFMTNTSNKFLIYNSKSRMIYERMTRNTLA